LARGAVRGAVRLRRPGVRGCRRVQRIGRAVLAAAVGRRPDRGVPLPASRRSPGYAPCRRRACVTVEQTPTFDLLILGARFAGVELASQPGKRRSALRVAVADRQAEHGYIPLVQERLAARTPPEQTVLPTRAYVESRPGYRYILGEVASFDPQSREVTLVSGERLRARFVVVALGS